MESFSVSVVDRMTMYPWMSSAVCCWQALFLRGSCSKGAEAVEDLAKAAISERHRFPDRKPKRSRSTLCFFIRVLCSKLLSISTLGSELYTNVLKHLCFQDIPWRCRYCCKWYDSWPFSIMFVLCLYLELYQLHWWSPLKQLRRCATICTGCSCGATKST